MIKLYVYFFSIDKLTGALYLGELARHILSQFVVDGILFQGSEVEKLQLPESFPTKYISEILGHVFNFFKHKILKCLYNILVKKKVAQR